jgi:O-antigen ligase
MVASEKKEDKIIIEKSIMISALIFSGLITWIYFKEGAFSGGPNSLKMGRFYLQGVLGMKVNALGGLAVYYFIACTSFRVNKAKWLKIFATSSILAGALFTLSRMAWLAMAIILSIQIPKMKWSFKILILILSLGIYWQFHTLIKNRIYAGYHKETSQQERRIDNVSMGRISLWRETWDFAKENITFGNGFMTVIISETGEKVNHPHNAYLRTILDMGIFGLSVFAVCMAIFFIRFRKVRGPFFYSLIAMLIMGMFGHIFYPSKENFLFWIFYGLELNEPSQIVDDGNKSKTLN